MRRFALPLMLMLSLTLSSARASVSELGDRPAGPTQPIPGCEYFQPTQHNLCAPFLNYWINNGGLSVFGYPVTEAFTELNQDLNQEFLTQYLERERMEHHPDNAGTPYEILLGRLGHEVLLLQGRNWNAYPKADPSTAHYMAETGHAIAPEFWDYYRAHGLELGDEGVSLRESVALFGFPISPAMMETNSSGDTVLTQWYERARFELHPDDEPGSQVKRGLLGNELLATPPQPPPTAGSGQLAFAGVLEGASSSEIYLVSSDGAGLHPVWGWPTVESYAVHLVWSPDGQRLAFFGHDADVNAAFGGYSALFVLDPDRGETTNLNLTDLRDVDFMWGPPSWSPDGRLLYVSLPPPSTVPDGVNPDAHAGILAIPVDGSAAPTWLITLEELDMQAPILRLSPDGQTIAALVGEPPQLMVVRVDDPQMRVVVGEQIINSAPAWSPDSQQIAFIGMSPDGIGQLYVVNADGSGLSQLTDHQSPEAVASGFTGGDPVWSPDGQQIAYTVNHAATPETQQLDVYVTSVDGSGTRNLSNDPEHADTGASWSPDGRELAFVSQPADAWRAGEEPSSADIRVIMADGTNLRTVVAGLQSVQFEPFMMEGFGLPAWRPTAP